MGDRAFLEHVRREDSLDRVLDEREPIVHFETPHGPHPWSRFLALETFVFDVRGEKRRTVSAVE